MSSSQALTRVMVRPIASPLPLGFFAFGVGIAISSCLELHMIPAGEAHHVALALLTFVAPMELLAAVIAFLARDTAGATTLGIFGGSWVTYGLSLLTAPPGATNAGLAAFFFAISVAMIVLAVVAAKAKPFFTLLLSLAFVRYVLAGLQLASGAAGLRVAAGVVGWVIVAVAFYGALALLLEDLRKKTVLPLFRRGAAREAIESDLDAQLEDVAREPGVREQL